MVLVTVYALASTGLNLQKDCWRVHCVESSHNLGIREQAIGRVCRMGNPSEFVWVTEYFIPDTFDDRAMCRNIAKALPQAMAELNRSIFAGENEGELTIDVGEWVLEDGRLVRWEDAKKVHPRPLWPNEVLIEILKGAKGEEVVT